jgi:hypothetical protein
VTARLRDMELDVDEGSTASVQKVPEITIATDPAIPATAAMPRAPLDVAQDHPLRGRREAAEAQAFEQERPELRGRRGPQRFGGLQRDHAADRGERAAEACRERHQRAGGDDPRREHVAERGKAEELGVERGDRASQPVAQGDAEQDPGGDHHGRELQIMEADREVVVPQRLERRDFAALRIDLAVQHHVEDECRDQQEHRGQYRAHDALLFDLLRQDLCEICSARP